MDKLLGSVSTLERVIRNLLSGCMIVVVYLLSLSNPFPIVEWIERNPLIAGVVVVVLGIACYTIYRVVFWQFGDWIARLSGISAPSLLQGRTHAQAYAWFLQWRHSGNLAEGLSHYLWYRWAAAHFTFLIGMALLFASFLKQERSVVANYSCPALISALMLILLGGLQCYFLFQVERSLRQTDDRDRPSRNTVAIAAYFLWEHEGRLEGRSQEYWLRAEEQLRRLE